MPTLMTLERVNFSFVHFLSFLPQGLTHICTMFCLYDVPNMCFFDTNVLIDRGSDESDWLCWLLQAAMSWASRLEMQVLGLPVVSSINSTLYMFHKCSGLQLWYAVYTLANVRERLWEFSSILADGFECSSNVAKLRVPSELNDQQGLSTSRILRPLDFELCAFSGNLISDT